MLRWGFIALSLNSLIFAAFSASNNYQLNSYGVGPGGSNNAASTTYNAQATVGEQANGSTSGSTYTANNGSIQTEQLNVPGAPTLSNGSGTYYNMLNCIINTSSDPTDTTYAIAVSTNSFVTTNYVQASGALGSSPVYQSYTNWGGSGGFSITGLTSSTTYEVKVAALEGLYTNTEYGPFASASTVSPTISFSVSPNSASLGSFLPNTIVTSSNVTFNFATNGASGGSIYVIGKYGGFDSPSKGFLISAVSGNLSSLSQGFGIQGTGPSQTSGGPLTVLVPFNGTGHTVGAESTTTVPMFSSVDAIAGGTANANVQVEAPITAPAANDYTEVFTFSAAASF